MVESLLFIKYRRLCVRGSIFQNDGNVVMTFSRVIPARALIPEASSLFHARFFFFFTEQVECLAPDSDVSRDVTSFKPPGACPIGRFVHRPGVEWKLVLPSGLDGCDLVIAYYVVDNLPPPLSMHVWKIINDPIYRRG